ncbi:alpha/beta hydrolase fold domain-containing protein [Pelagicoccus sp. SDUM812002]|uniref:alpha/beta hydrolase n=1 Tax=Pelagicoccus sp. SDUM812002 TaxID=3041266 RepID=UPI00280C7BA4|nr:alpha/beta hydrolase fold domain-containing protein [Pelagicoccus sp. SDUM812002]MDQ8188034.1 alpha/beta hydrolase fold domain-containing protein [Pelagicoccus sp. SDUM812002]
MNTRLLASTLILLVSTCFATAQTSTVPEPPPPTGVPAPGPQTDEPYAPTPILPGGTVIPLYSPDSPHLDQSRIHEAETYGSYTPPHLGFVANIHNPSIEFHAANGALNTGTAVILAAGGGHNNLNVVGEGASIVPFLTANGINAVILRNRLRSDGYEPKTDGVHDAQQAIKLVRAHAGHWNLDTNRIGFVGFSAGAELAAAAAIEYPTFEQLEKTPDNALATISSRPDFIGLVYPGPSPFAFGGAAEIPRDAPPAFFASPGWGDWIHAIWATEYFTALLEDGVPNCELHIYARGVHPGDRGQPDQAPATAGISRRDGVAFGKWQDSYLQWLEDLGFLQKPGLETQAARDVARNTDRPDRISKYREIKR